MKLNDKLVIGILATVTLATISGTSIAANLKKPFANRSFYCEGGNESNGNHYYFRMGSSTIERVDHRFPNKGVQFTLEKAQKGSLNNHWSFETLSQLNPQGVRLFERVSMRDPSQTRHIYRTYEMFARDGKMYMTLYDGVNGVRDWRMKTTRKCGYLVGNRISDSPGNRYWSTTLFSR